MKGVFRFDFYPRDWFHATRGLSQPAKGVYIDILAAMYARGGPLPYDEHELCGLTGCKTVRSLRPILRELIDRRKFTLAEGFLTNDRVMFELAKANKRMADGARGGRGKSSFGKESVQAEYDGNTTGTQPETRPSFVENQGDNPKLSPSPSPKKEKKYAFEGQVVRLTEPDFQRWESAFKNVNLRALLESRDAWLSGQPDAVKKTWFQSTAAWLANRDAEAAKAAPADGGDIDPNWRERMERAEATLRVRDGKIVPGPGFDRKTGPAA